MAGSEPTIYLKPKASTGTKLHELYHAKYSPQLQDIEKGNNRESPYEFALEELNAEGFVREKRGKPLSIRLRTLSGISTQMLKYWSPSIVMTEVQRASESLGYRPLTRSERSHLWSYLKSADKNTEMTRMRQLVK